MCYFRHHLLRRSWGPNSHIYNQMQIRRASLHTGAAHTSTGVWWEEKRVGDSLPDLHCLMWDMCAGSICASLPSASTLPADTRQLCWLLVALAGEDQRVHLRPSRLFKTYNSVPLCYSGLGNAAAPSLRSTAAVGSGARTQLESIASTSLASLRSLSLLASH